MAWNGSGTFVRIYSWVVDQSNGIDVRADRMDTDTDDIANGFTNCLTRDGQGAPIANITWAGYKITNLANGTAAADAVNFGQVFSSPVFTSPTALADPPSGDSTKLLATTNWVAQLAFSTALPAQANNANKTLTTDGSSASWAPLASQTLFMANNYGGF